MSNVENVAEALFNATQILVQESELVPEYLQFISQTFTNIVEVESVMSEVSKIVKLTL